MICMKGRQPGLCSWKTAAAGFACASLGWAGAADMTTNTPASSAAPESHEGDSGTNRPTDGSGKSWNFHAQNTDIIQYHPAFNAPYSGPNSLPHNSEVKNTESLDLMFGARLWPGAEAHVDALVWQGFGFGETAGIENFPDNEAFRAGTYDPNINAARVFIRQTIGLGGEQETIADDQLHLARQVDVSRITLTVGRMSVGDIFDNNAYANDARTQFISWGLVNNEAWDYAADSLGYITGLAVELNQPNWTLRYGFFQVPKFSNRDATDQDFLKAWSMVLEFERRWKIGDYPGTARLMASLEEAHMGNYSSVVADPSLTIDETADYRDKYGFYLNLEQEIAKDVGAFMRLGWSDGKSEAWVFADVDRAISGGLSFNGDLWRRPNDTFGAAEVISGLSTVHAQFLAMGGTGILAGDGNLNYGWEESTEAYYDCDLYKNVHAALDFQFIENPAFNQDRGPVYVFGARLHWEF